MFVETEYDPNVYFFNHHNIYLYVALLLILGINFSRLLLPQYCSSLPSDNDLPILVPMEEITSLEPGQTTKRIVYVHFHHHLLPLKLALYCNNKKFSVKLRPDIGYFVKPLPMDIEAFTDKESRLPGMFEYTRRSVSFYLIS